MWRVLKARFGRELNPKGGVCYVHYTCILTLLQQRGKRSGTLVACYLIYRYKIPKRSLALGRYYRKRIWTSSVHLISRL